MSEQQTHAVTGAYGYSGKYIAQRLLNKRYRVITLTNSMHRSNPFGKKVRAYPFNFDNPKKLKKSLKGVRVLYNTYWVRFNYKLFTLADALRNSLTLLNAAKEAGVRKIVHISITNPSEDSHLEYFRGKAKLEKALMDTGLSYSIIRPTVLFGKEDILINNIAWALHKLPVFAVFGNGHYRLQPIYVDDLSELAVEHGEKEENSIIDAIGPETFTYRELIQTIGNIIGIRKPIISVPPALVYIAGMIISQLVNDVLVTREEIEGLMSNLLCVNSSPTGKTRLTDWIEEHAESLGKQYTSELARRIDRKTEYKSN